MALGEQLGHGRAHAAGDVVLLDGDHAAALRGGCHDRLLVERLHAHHVHDLGRDALGRELLSGLERVGDLDPARHDGDVGALAQHVGGAELAGEALIVDLGQRLAAQAHIEGAGRARRQADRRAGARVVGGHEHPHAGQHAHERDVLQRLVRGAVGAHGDARVRGADLDVEPGVAHGIADLLPAAAGAEHGERGREHRAAGEGEPGGHTDHVLLGDAHVHQAIGIGGAQLAGGGGSAQVGVDGHDVHALVDQLHQGLAECGARSLEHGAHAPFTVAASASYAASSSANARSASSAEGATPCQEHWSSMKETPLPLTVLATITTGDPRAPQPARAPRAGRRRRGRPRRARASRTPRTVGHGLDGVDVAHVAVDLQVVAVHDGDEVVQMPVAREHGGLPVLPLLHLAVAQKAEHALRRPTIARRVQAEAQRDAGGDGEALAQRARAHLNPRAQVRVRMALQAAAHLAQRQKLLMRQVADLGEQGVEDGRGMPLGRGRSGRAQGCADRPGRSPARRRRRASTRYRLRRASRRGGPTPPPPASR